MSLSDTIIVPDVFVTVDNSKANTSLGGAFKTVIIGQMLSTGTATKETFVQVFSDDDAKAKFGVGSILSNMFSAWFANNSINEVYAVALEDSATAVQSAGEISFGSTNATESGAIYLYLNGKKFFTPVASGDTPTEIAAAVMAVVNADVNMPVLAAVAAGVIYFAGKNHGTLTNQTKIELNKGDGEAIPAGLTSAVITDSAGGLNDPDIELAIAALPDEVLSLIISPYTDAANTTKLDTEITRRWGNTTQLDGHAIMATYGTSSTVVTLGGTLNSEHFTIMDGGKDASTPAFLIAPQVGGEVALSADVDPARPFRTLPIIGMIGDDPTDRRTFNEKNSILTSGISTHVVQPDSTVTIDRLVTTYKTNALGAPDTSYQNTNTMFNLSFMRQSFKTRMLSLYPRHKLADDGTRFGAGQPIATPSSIKGDIVSLYQQWINLGLAEDVDTFADTLLVARDTVNRSRVNVTMQPILIGQLYQFDTTLQFIV